MLKVPYPMDTDYNATLEVGICDKLNALRVVKDNDGNLERERPKIVSLMAQVDAGREDATIYGRHRAQGLPKIYGNQNDSLVDLPLVLQQELTTISGIVTAYVGTWKNYKVCPLVLFSFALSFVYDGCVLLVGFIQQS